ncbi:ATP-dependent dethiobiotin synthetase BioD, partial [Mesorhizobium sp. M1A.F.Ca.IN.020.32.1.1]
ECTIAGTGQVRVLGRLPLLDPLTAGSLRSAMTSYFDMAAFDEVNG